MRRAPAAATIDPPAGRGMGRRDRWILAVLVATILVGTLMPAREIVIVYRSLWSFVPWEIVGHFGLFGGIGVLMAKNYGWRRSLAYALAWGVGLGGGTELLQHFSPGRAPEWKDFGVDVAGTSLGWLVGTAAMAVAGVWRKRTGQQVI